MAASTYRLSELYPNRKPFMDENGKRKVPDLRTHVLTEEAKRLCHGIQGKAEVQSVSGIQQQYAGHQGGRAPTDFAGFFEELKQQPPTAQQPCQQQQGWQQDMQQQNQQISNGSTRFSHQQDQQQQQQQQQHQDFSLEELLSQHSLHAAPPPQQQIKSFINLDRTFAPDASRDAFMPVPGADVHGSSAAAAAAQERWHLQNMQLLPWDWSVKAKVRLSSAAPFAVLEEQRTTGLAPVCQAVAAGGQCNDTANQSNQERLAQALMQYQHPSMSMSVTMMTALRAGPDKEGPASLTARVNCWREALRSAYTALRHGHCPVVYVMGQAFRQQFTVVFCAPDVLGCQQLHAVVGRTNKQLRQHFASFGCVGQVAGMLEQQQQREGQQQPPRQQLTASAFDGQAGSQFLVCGALQVHGLYAALQALPWCGPEQPDVPMLAAPVQFMHAVLSPLRLEVLPDAVHDQQLLRQQDQAVQHPHFAELTTSSGVGIMPWTLHRLLTVMADSQGPVGFDAYLEAEPSSSTLNMLPGSWEQLETAASVGSAGKDVEGHHQQQQLWKLRDQGLGSHEQQTWAASRVLLQGRMLRQLRMRNDGELVARLA